MPATLALSLKQARRLALAAKDSTGASRQPSTLRTSTG